MNRKKILLIVMAALLVVSALSTAAIVTNVNAQSGTTTPPTPSETSPSDDEKVPGLGRIGFGENSLQLANALGITTDELATAYNTAYGKAIDQALTLGYITQTQADRLKSSYGMARNALNGWLSADEWATIDFTSLLAEALNITVDELNTAFATAQKARLDEAVASGDLTQEQADLRSGLLVLRDSAAFRDSIKSAYQTAIADAVKAGTITQAQADAILAQIDSKNGKFGLGFGYGFGLGYGLGSEGQGMMGNRGLGGMMRGGRGR